MDNVKDLIVQYKQRIENETKEDKVLRLLQKLKSLTITVELLQVTGIGKTVSALRKWNGKVGNEARNLVTDWKQVCKSSSVPQKKIKEEEEGRRGGGHDDGPREEAGHGRLSGHHPHERNGVCADRRQVNDDDDDDDEYDPHHESKKAKKWSEGVVVKREKRSPSPSLDSNRTPFPPPYIPTKKIKAETTLKTETRIKKNETKVNPEVKIKTETKPRRKLVDVGGDGFNASMASFEDCLGLNDVKPRVASSQHLSSSSSSPSSSSSSKVKKSSKVLDKSEPKVSSNSSDKKSRHSKSVSKNLESPSSETKVKVKVEVKQERSSPINTPQSMDVVAPPLPLIKKPVMNDVDILSNLPAIQPDYKPLRFFPAPDSPPTSKKRAYEMDSTTFMSSRHTRTQVFSGRKNFQYLSEVPSLLNSCVKVLQDNVSVLYDLMYAPYHLLKPVLLRCSAERLQFLEDNNPYLLDETDELWRALCQKQFKGVEPDEFESWRELHYRLAVARDNKLKSITANISRSMAKAVPVRQTKMAFLDCVVKPPRNVARQQAKFGTATKTQSAKEKLLKPLRPSAATTAKVNAGSSRPSSSSSSAPSADPSPSSSAQQQKAVKKVAPLMQKTLKFMKNRFRR